MNTFQRAARVMNRAVAPLLDAPVVGPILGRSMVVISYQGRRSGRTFSLPVAYTRKGDEVSIGVAMPDKKSWWRNFAPDGHAVSLELDGVERSGIGVAHRTDKGAVYVKVRLDPS